MEPNLDQSFQVLLSCLYVKMVSECLLHPCVGVLKDLKMFSFSEKEVYLQFKYNREHLSCVENITSVAQVVLDHFEYYNEAVASLVFAWTDITVQCPETNIQSWSITKTS